jgi:hypothetical protein
MCLCSTQNGAFVLPTFQSQAPGGCHSSLASLLTLVPKASPSTLTPMPLLSLRSPLLAIEMPAMSSLTSCCLAHPRRRASHRRRTLVSFTDTVQGKGKAPLEEGSPKGPGQPAPSPRSRFHGLCPSQPVGPAPV